MSIADCSKNSTSISIRDLIIGDGYRPDVDQKGVECFYCPFHVSRDQQKTLYLDSQENRFTCSACRITGGSEAWIMNTQGVEHKEALHIMNLLSRGVSTISNEDLDVCAERRQARLRRSTAWFEGQLKENTQALDYLRARDVDQWSMSRFQLGWCGDAMDIFTGRSDTKKFLLPYWRDGLFGRGVDGTFYPRFNNRLIFPIKDIDGHTVGYGGRAMPGASTRAKYINSKGSWSFRKGDILYGLWETLQGSRYQERIFVVEGYMDVIRLHQCGIDSAVAAMGTALTDSQIETLCRITDHLTFCFDQDSAGKKAALKSVKTALPSLYSGLKCDVMMMDEGDDPDSFIMKNGPDAFLEESENAIPYTSLILNEEMKTAIQRRASIRKGGNRCASDVLRVIDKARAGNGMLDKAVSDGSNRYTADIECRLCVDDFLGFRSA